MSIILEVITEGIWDLPLFNFSLGTDMQTFIQSLEGGANVSYKLTLPSWEEGLDP